MWCELGHALPRFAARNGMDCLQCHVNPSGGGMRNSYGRNVFEQAWLPVSSSEDNQQWLADDFKTDNTTQPQSTASAQRSAFAGDVTEWLAIGGDFRAAYIFIRPKARPAPDKTRDITSSFFLMQGDLYHAITPHEHLTLVLDVGVYSGFEAWGMLNLLPMNSNANLLLKVGRFLPAFGIREVEHQLFTREGIGFGNSDKDTGAEVTGFWGPLMLQAALLNGTVGDIPFDNHGTRRRPFEKALVARGTARGQVGLLRGQLGGSYYFSSNSKQANPLLAGTIPSDAASDVSRGVDETRASGFVTANVGRLTYLGELAVVRDKFYGKRVNPVLSPRKGYASYQELSWVVTQGLECVGTFEFMDPDTEVNKNATRRAGLILEFFPWPFTEFRAMVRRTWRRPTETLPGGNWDAVLFAHFFI